METILIFDIFFPFLGYSLYFSVVLPVRMIDSGRGEFGGGKTPGSLAARQAACLTGCRSRRSQARRRQSRVKRVTGG